MASRAKGQHNTKRIHQIRKLIIVVWLFVGSIGQEPFQKYKYLVYNGLKTHISGTVPKVNSLKNIFGQKEEGQKTEDGRRKMLSLIL